MAAMAATIPSMTGLANNVANALLTIIVKATIVFLINITVPTNELKVEINLPTINIAGPIAATTRAAFTINPCVSGLSDLKPSTKKLILSDSAIKTLSNCRLSLITFPRSANEAVILSFKLSKLLPKPACALDIVESASTVFLLKSAADMPVAFIPSAVDAPNVSFNKVLNPGNLSAN
jgi:hypothetical protein